MKQIALVMLFAAAVFVSCKKDKGFRYKGCRIREVKETVDDPSLPKIANYQFVYNDEGMVQQITKNYRSKGPVRSLVKVFAYTKNSIRILNISEQQVSGRDSLVLDVQGRVVKMFNGISEGSLPQDWKEYTYDSEGQMTALLYNSYQGNPTIDSAFWANGNIVRYTRTYLGTTSFYYDERRFSYYDTVYNIGVINAPLEELLLYGRGIIRVNKLEKSDIDITNKDVEHDRSYKLDNDGKILEMTEAMPAADKTTTWQISYDCR